MKPCIHFGACGGCTLQHLSPDAYRAHKRQSVIDALARAGLGDMVVEEPQASAPHTRRRAVFKLARTASGVEVGFHARASHTIVDMHECLVLTPALLGLTATLRAGLAPLLHEGEKAELHVTGSDTGLDLSFRAERKLTPALTTALARALTGHGIARLIWNGQTVMEEGAPQLVVAGAQVSLPPNAFLQATCDGEAALQARVLELAGKARHVADLFAGLGTFTLALAKKARVHAVEQDAALLAALAAAAKSTSGLKPVTTEKRDLFKQPLSGSELKAFDAVVLDPPRAGAAAQTRALAAARVPRIVYVSCDAASFARDAAILKAAGYRPGPVAPIDQFLFSGHIELVGSFERSGK